MLDGLLTIGPIQKLRLNIVFSKSQQKLAKIANCQKFLNCKNLEESTRNVTKNTQNLANDIEACTIVKV